MSDFNLKQFKKKIKKDIKIINSIEWNNIDGESSQIYRFPIVNDLFEDIANYFYNNIQFFKVIIGEKNLGKTASIQALSRDLASDGEIQKELENNLINLGDSKERFENSQIPFFIYINCKIYNSKYKIIKRIIKICQFKTKSKLSVDEIMKRYFKNLKVLIVLDEVEYIRYEFREGVSIFSYLMLNNPENLIFSMILITNKIKWLDKIRKKDKDFAQRYFIDKNNKVPWIKPSTKQIFQILKMKVNNCIEGEISDKFLHEISSIIYSKYSSNISLALKTLNLLVRRIILMEDFEILSLIKEQYIEMIKDEISSLRDRELICLILTNQNLFSSEIFKLYNFYQNKVNGCELSKPVFLNILEKLDNEDYIKYKKLGDRTKSPVSLTIDIFEIQEEIISRFDKDFLFNLYSIIKEFK